MVLTEKHIRHMELCGTELLNRAEETPTLIRAPSKKFFLFSKYETTVDHRYTAYFDLETFNTELYPSCMECSELMQLSPDKNRREVTYEFLFYCFNNIFSLGYLQ